MSVQIFKGNLFTVYKFPDGTEIYFHSTEMIQKIPHPEKITWRASKPTMELFSFTSGIKTVNINGNQYVATDRDLCFDIPNVNLEYNVLKKVGWTPWWLGRSLEEMTERFNQVVSMIGDVTPRIFLLQDGSPVLTIGDKFAQYITNDPAVYDQEEKYLDRSDEDSKENQIFDTARAAGAFSWIARDKEDFSETLIHEIQGQIVREIDISELKQGFMIRAFDLMGITTLTRPSANVSYVSGVIEGHKSTENEIFMLIGPDYAYEINLNEPGYVSVNEINDYMVWNKKFTEDSEVQQIIISQMEDAEWIRYSSHDTLILQLACLILKQKCIQAGVPLFNLSIYDPETNPF